MLEREKNGKIKCLRLKLFTRKIEGFNMRVLLLQQCLHVAGKMLVLEIAKSMEKVIKEKKNDEVKRK